MTIVLDRFQPCRLCGSALKPCYLNMEEMIYMCTSAQCTFPLMTPDLQKFICSQDMGNGVIDELSQDPYFAEMFGTGISASTLSTSLSASRAITPPYSAASVCSEGDEDFVHMSLVNCALIATLCISSAENLDNSLIASLFHEVSRTMGSDGDSAAACASKLFEMISEKIVFFRPNDSTTSVSVRLNQLITRLLTDCPALLSNFKLDSSTSATCDVCGFFQTWSSQAPSLQLKSFSRHENMNQITCIDACSECGSSSRNFTTKLTRISKVLLMCCHEKASLEITKATGSASPFVDFERSEEGCRYVLTTVVKYDEHLRRIVVVIRRTDEKEISDVNNWHRYDSLESFLSGRFSNPPSFSWLTSSPLILIWQRVDQKPWHLFDTRVMTGLHSLSSANSTLAANSSVINGASQFMNIMSQQPRSSASSVSSASYKTTKPNKNKFVLSPPPPISSQARVEHPASIKLPNSVFNMTPSNSLFIQRSLERLTAHRRKMESSGSSRSSSNRAASQISSTQLSSSRTNDSIISPRSSTGSEPKRARLDTPALNDDFDL